MSACWYLPQSAMRSMISWRITGTGGWDERPPVAFQLRQNVTDLSDDEDRKGEVADVLGYVISSFCRVHDAR